MSRRLALLSLATALLVGLAPAGPAAADCSRTLGRSVAKYVKARGKAIAACERRRSSGRLPDTTVCRPQCSSAATNAGDPCLTDGDCPSGTCEAVTDATTSARLDRAVARATTQIAADCGTLPPIGPACDSAADAAALAACVTDPLQDDDNDTLNVDTLSRALYGSPVPVDPSLRTCQTTIGRQVARYLQTRLKIELRCHERLATGRIAGPCPDATTADALEAARGKLDVAVRAKCTEAELAAASPALGFGEPCKSYKLLSFTRDGMTSNNSLPVLDRFLGCMTDAAAGTADRYIDTAYPAPETSDFALGVAAGDATDSAAIFWTKLPDSTSGAFLDVSTDPTFASGVQTVAVTSPGGSGGVVKEEVGSLAAKTTYHYRFRQGASESVVGQLTTAPSPGDATQIVRLGWSGDSNAFYRPYTSLDPLRLLAPDAWFYIGDTIYGDDPAADGVVAMTEPEYEAKYQVNRADASLRNILAATGTYVQWDDHEVRNDFAGAEPVFAARMAAGNTAFRRYMPLREDGGDPMQLYRSFQWGSGAEFFLIDDRQYRSAKYTCCSDPVESGFVTTDDDSTCTGGLAGEALLPGNAAPDFCTDTMAGASRTILGAAQKAWLENGLLNSTATFKFIMNGPPMTQLLFDPYDRWEAWIAERNEILDFIETNGIKNVVWLSTDLHAVVLSPTHVDADNATHPATELVVGSIAESTLFRELPPTVLTLLGAVPGLIKQVSQYELDRYNTVLITVDPTVAPPTARFDIYDRTGAMIRTVTLTATP
jgi:alkaline phosphatase D